MKLEASYLSFLKHNNAKNEIETWFMQYLARLFNLRMMMNLMKKGE